MATKTSRVDALHKVPASAVKTGGWRGVMRTLREQGAVVVTNHDEPEAVIIPAKEYAALVETVTRAESRTASELEALRLRFDERLAALRAPGAGARLRSIMRGRARLRGKVKAGAGY
jgi:prevent-host-death family protein